DDDDDDNDDDDDDADDDDDDDDVDDDDADDDEGKEIMKSTIQWEIIPVMIAFVFQFPRLAWRSRKMSKKWPWKKWRPYLDVPLAEIRREFGIKVI
ncbi:MAG: hypothetical protein H8E63_11275, partial [Proteobacteria bacterium]|nr:hypothetical protein [Pseudomonadota bacterium]